jgi:hypothetical protein
MPKTSARFTSPNAGWIRCHAALPLALALALAACGGGGGSSPPSAPAGTPAATLVVTSSATTTMPNGASITLDAVVTNSTATPTWTLTGAGTLSTSSGGTVQYLPPDSEIFDQAGTVVVSASIAGAPSQSVTLTLTPVAIAGLTWTNVVATSIGSLQSVDFADGRYVAVSDQGSALTSADAATWTPAAVLSSGQPTDHFNAMSIAHIGSTLVAAGSVSPAPYTTSTGAIATSADGLAWTMASTPAITVPIHAVVVGPHALALGDTGHIYSSSDGRSWALVTTIFGVGALNAGVYAANQYVTVGDGGYIAVSADGVTWAAGKVIIVGGTGINLHGVAYDGTKFIAVGDNGLIATSADGYSWFPQTSALAGSLRSVAVSPAGELVIAGDAGIETSKDTVSWHLRDAVGAAALLDVAFLNGQFVAVGAASAIRTSDH